MRTYFQVAPITLSIFDVFDGLSEIERTSVLTTSKLRECKSGEVIISQGDILSEVHFIISGTFIFKRRSEVDPCVEVVAKLCGVGDGMGDGTLFQDFPFKGTIEALGDAVVLSINKQVLSEIAEANSKVMKALYLRSAKKIIGFIEGMDKQLGELSKRLEALHVDLEKAGVPFPKSLTKTEMAKMLGVSRVAVSQVMNRAPNKD